MSKSGQGISRDFYPTKEMADEKRETTQTNPRYKRFKQEYYTAGDEEQFNEERYKVPGNGAKYEDGTDEVDCEPSRIWHKHAGVSDDDVTNTYRYISRKFKKGIYVRIQDGKVVTYLPFSNANYVNEWSGQIVDTPDDIIAMMASIKKREGYKFYPNSINRNMNEWYANNSLIRNEFPLNEGETNMGNIKNMLEELCAERGILFMVDEVQTGLGRTGEWFGFQHFGVQPDVVTMTKALGNGVPIGACAAKREVAAAFEPGDHATTFGGQPLATAAAKAVLTEMRRIDAPALATKAGERIRTGLEALPAVGTIRGLGLLLGVELVERDAKAVAARLLDDGLVVNAVTPTALRLAPPLTVSDAEIDEAVAMIAAALESGVGS